MIAIQELSKEPNQESAKPAASFLVALGRVPLYHDNTIEVKIVEPCVCSAWFDQ